MDMTTNIKRIVASNGLLKWIAELLLNAYTQVRFAVVGGYTSGGEDLAAFKRLEEKFRMKPEDMRYIDIGAYDYRRGNNSYLLYRKGARGVLVEANPVYCLGLSRKRPGDTVVNAAVSDRPASEPVRFYVCSLPTRSTMSKERAEELVRQGFRISEEVDVPCKTVAEIAGECGFLPDMLSVDCESMDFLILQSIDFTELPVKVVIAEQDDESRKSGEAEEMDRYMEKQGYRIIKKTKVNVIYERI